MVLIILYRNTLDIKQIINTEKIRHFSRNIPVHGGSCLDNDVSQKNEPQRKFGSVVLSHILPLTK